MAITLSSKPLATSLAVMALLIPLASSVVMSQAQALGISIMGGGGVPVTPPVTPPDASPSPTPSASPTPQSAPVIITSTLGDVKIGQTYSGEVSAVDANVTDSLSMTITGLPDGLSATDCATEMTSEYSIITCDVEGTPTQAKMYNVRVNATDNHGGSDAEKLHLKVTKK